MKLSKTEVFEKLKIILIVYAIITSILLVYTLTTTYEITIQGTTYKQNIFNYIIGRD